MKTWTLALLFTIGCGGTAVDDRVFETSSSADAASSSSASSSHSASSSSSSSNGAGGGGGAPSVGNGGGGAAPLGSCDGIEALTLSDPFVIGESGEGAWFAGTLALAQVNILNTGATAFTGYPGVTFASKDPLVTTAMPSDDELFGLESGQGLSLSTTFAADPSMAPGTVVHFTATVNTISGACPNAMTIEFQGSLFGN